MGLFSYLKSKFSKKENSTKYEKGLAKSRAAFADRLEDLSKRYKKVDNSYFEELEQILIEADVGVALTLKLVENLLDKSQKEGISEPSKINEELIDQMFVSYVEGGESITNEIQFAEEGPTVLLVEGVNGVGKTTSIAKLAHRYMQKGKKVMLVAADTFRAGAVEQLKIWADRLKCPIVTGLENGDPASVCYDGAKYAKANKVDLMIVDTAGRLHNKANLMAELGKIKRVLEREIPGAPHETFLIIDATFPSVMSSVSQSASSDLAKEWMILRNSTSMSISMLCSWGMKRNERRDHRKT